MGVEAGMQDEQQQAEQGQPAAAAHPVNQQRREETAGKEEEMRQYMAGKVDAAAVFQPHRPFRQQQKDLESHLMVAFDVVQQAVILP